MTDSKYVAVYTGTAPPDTLPVDLEADEAKVLMDALIHYDTWLQHEDELEGDEAFWRDDAFKRAHDKLKALLALLAVTAKGEQP